MTRYYFHLSDGVFVPDEEGQELPDIDAAKHVAVQMLVETLRGNSRKLWDTDSLRVIVGDAAGLTLFSLELSATLSPVLMSGRPQAPALEPT